jgi:peptide/nickel transport system substrate-binding protein
MKPIIRTFKFAVWACTAFALCCFPALAAKDNDSLTVAWPREIANFDFYFLNVLEGTTLAQHICDTLIWRDLETQEFKPLLATKWEWVDPKILELTLREGVKFHNGEAFDADDVVYTLNWASNPETRAVSQVMVNWIDRAEKISAYKVRIYTKQANPAVLDFLATGVHIYPHEYHSKVGSNGFSRKPIGTGPYKVKSIEAGTNVVLEKNKDYFSDSPKGTPSIGTITIRYLKDENVRMGELITGQIDWIGELTADQTDQLRTVPGLKVLESPSTYFGYLMLKSANLDHKSPIQDIRVRKAIAHGVNRDAMVANLARGISKRLDTFCNPILKGCLDGVAAYAYDPALSKKLLAEAGYPNGFSIDIYAFRDRYITEAIIGDLRSIGINAKLNFVQFPVLRERWLGGQLSMGHITWGGLGGLMDVSSTLSNYFLGGASDPAKDPTVIEEIAQGNRSFEEKERFSHYATALKRLGEGVHWLPLYTITERYAFTDQLEYTPAINGVNRFYMAKWK